MTSSHSRRRLAAATAWLCSLASPTGLAQTADAERHWAAMAQCAAIEPAPARHACTDAVLLGAGLLPKVEPRPATADAAAKPEPSPPEDRTVTLAEVVKRGDGKLRLTTTDGVVWRQTVSDTIRQMPKAGDTMDIRRGAFGGYKCQVGRWTSFRCTSDPA